MTTSVSGWPKLSHRRCKSACGLLLIAAIAAAPVSVCRAAAPPDGNSRYADSGDPFQPLTGRDTQGTLPRSTGSGATRSDALRSDRGRAASPQVAPSTPTESATSHHKSWKELAHAHNESKPAEPADAHASHDAPESATKHSPWAAVSALAVVICLILILARIFRRHAPLFAQTLPSEAVEILGRRFIDQRQSIVLLRVGSRILVVGSSTAGLQGLGELTDAVEVDLIAGMCRGARNGNNLGTSFFNLLKGQAATQRSVPPRPVPQRSEPQRTEAPRRREPQVPAPSVGGGPTGPRASDPEHELMRRLRGGPTAGSAASEIAEVFRD